MSLIPMMRCRDMQTSVAFLPHLDFELADAADDAAECDFITLARGGDRLALSRDDGVFGTVVVVTTADVDGCLSPVPSAKATNAGQSAGADAGA